MSLTGITISTHDGISAGSETTIHLKMGQTDVLAKEIGIRNYQVDRQVGLRIDPDKINVFDKTTGRLIKLAVPD